MGEDSVTVAAASGMGTLATVSLWLNRKKGKEINTLTIFLLLLLSSRASHSVNLTKSQSIKVSLPKFRAKKSVENGPGEENIESVVHWTKHSFENSN